MTLTVLPTLGSTTLLVSVRDVSEAAAAKAGGADWIDLKEPQAGPLGAVGRCVADEVAQQVTRGSSLPLTAAAGELLQWESGPARELLAVTSLQMLKLGLADCQAHESWAELWLLAAREILSAGKRLVAVVYADHQGAKSPPFQQILNLGANTPGVDYLLIDTFDKRAGHSIRTIWTDELLAENLAAARVAGLRTVVAGSLHGEDLIDLPLPLIDVVAVRGAACRLNRNSCVEQELVSQLRGALSAASVARPMRPEA